MRRKIMETKTLFKKGIYLEVHSWENDGDYSQKNTKRVDSIEEAKALKHLVETLGASDHGRGLGIGNFGDHELEEAESNIWEYFNQNPWVIKALRDDHESYFDEEGNLKSDKKTKDYMYDIAIDRLGDLLGYSEYYICRVCDYVDLYEILEDVIIVKRDINETNNT